MYIPFFFFINPYIKKEDARKNLLVNRKMLGVLLIFIVATLGIIRFSVYPWLESVSLESSKSLPSITQTIPLVTVLGMLLFTILAIFFFLTQPDAAKVDQLLAKYKDGEMIKSNEIKDFKYGSVILILTGLLVGYFTISVVTSFY